MFGDTTPVSHINVLEVNHSSNFLLRSEQKIDQYLKILDLLMKYSRKKHSLYNTAKYSKMQISSLKYSNTCILEYYPMFDSPGLGYELQVGAS